MCPRGYSRGGVFHEAIGCDILCFPLFEGDRCVNTSIEAYGLDKTTFKCNSNDVPCSPCFLNSTVEVLPPSNLVCDIEPLKSDPKTWKCASDETTQLHLCTPTSSPTFAPSPTPTASPSPYPSHGCPYDPSDHSTSRIVSSCPQLIVWHPKSFYLSTEYELLLKMCGRKCLRFVRCYMLQCGRGHLLRHLRSG